MAIFSLKGWCIWLFQGALCMWIACSPIIKTLFGRSCKIGVLKLGEKNHGQWLKLFELQCIKNKQIMWRSWAIVPKNTMLSGSTWS
jgi:hypothetical protein